MEPGQSFAHYTVLEKIGAGGMGEVFRATDTRLNRDVALKVLPVFFAGDPERLARFRREAQVLAALNHPGIAAIHGLESEEGIHALAMELVEGPDLAERLEVGPLPVEEALRLALQIAEAVEAAHEKGVVHRDLKPANIKLTPEGQVKVLDFGLAKAMTEDASSSSVDPVLSPTMSPTLTANMTAAHVILGTAAYMSPEQARGTAVDKRADIWSFGLVMAEMLCGRRIFTGETVSDTLASVLKSVIDLEDLPDGLPSAARTLLHRCLQRDPRQRLRDIGDARIVLQEVIDGDHEAEPESSERPAGIGWLPVLASVIFMAVLTSGLTWWFARAAGPELPLRKSTVTMQHDDPAALNAFAPAISPSGRYVVYMSRGDLWLRDLAATAGQPIPGTRGGRQPFWSPDERWIGFATGDSLMKVERSGGQPVLVSKLTSGQTLSSGGNAVWGEDDFIYFSTGNTGILQVAANGGTVQERFVTDEGGTDIHEIFVLPGDRGWVYVLHGASGYADLSLVTPDGGRRILYSAPEGNINNSAYSKSGHLLFERTGSARGIWALPFRLEQLEVTGEPFLVANEGAMPSVANDGTLVYAAGTGSSGSQLVWITRDGKVERVITEVGPSRPFPDLSPDGHQIALCTTRQGQRELWIFDDRNESERRLTFDNFNCGVASWHPDGERLFAYSEPDYVGHLVFLDGSDRQQLWPAVLAGFTPDGEQLVYSRPREGDFDFDIYRRPLEGSEDAAVQMLARPTIEWYPKPSPDGRFLLFTSEESGRAEVYATTFPEPTARWQVSREGGSFARWRADGREIYFTTRDQILAVEVSTEGGLTLGKPRVLFTRPTTNWNSSWNDGFDVSADGQRFVMLRPSPDEEGPDPAIVVVQSWFSEFSED